MIDAVSTFEAIFSDNTPKPTKTRGGKMDAKALRESYPEAVAQIENEAIATVQAQATADAESKLSDKVSAAIDSERARVSALLAYNDKNPDLVASAIASGDSLETFAVSMLKSSAATPAATDADALARLQAAASEANPEASQTHETSTKPKNPIRALLDSARSK